MQGHVQSSARDYRRIAAAIGYIADHFQSQPALEDIAAHVGLSPFHFQRLFSDWAGVSPKKFMQYLSLEYAKKKLREDQASVLDTAYETGLSGSSRLHDLFVGIEAMTPGEYKQGGAGLVIRHSFADSPFGSVLVAATPKGICHMAFEENESAGLAQLKARFPAASYVAGTDAHQQAALQIFDKDWQVKSAVRLHLQGTAFQLKVWESLLKIPMGQLATYGTIAGQIGKPAASRAVGTAIGRNPVAFLIPCHRVIQSTGHIGGYMWGAARKSAIIGWEAAQTGEDADGSV